MRNAKEIEVVMKLNFDILYSVAKKYETKQIIIVVLTKDAINFILFNKKEFVYSYSAVYRSNRKHLLEAKEKGRGVNSEEKLVTDEFLESINKLFVVTCLKSSLDSYKDSHALNCEDVVVIAEKGLKMKEEYLDFPVLELIQL